MSILLDYYQYQISHFLSKFSLQNMVTYFFNVYQQDSSNLLLILDILNFLD